MAQFRTTADILDLALSNAGETTNGNSGYETQLLSYLNKVHFAVVAGGTIPISQDKSIQIDEVWPWAKAKRPMILELQPKFTTGSVTFTQDSEAGTFSSAPTVSVAGWYLRVTGKQEVLRIASHTASSTAFELDGVYTDDSGAGLTFEAFKLDYDLIPSFIVIDSTNNKFDFKKTTGGSVLTATLTAGSYLPSDLATHVATQVTTAAAGPTVTGSYSSVTRLFSFTSDGAGTTFLIPQFASGSNAGVSSHRVLGFDDQDYSAALTQTGTYVLGGICRIVEPFKMNKAANMDGGVYGIDAEAFQRTNPLTRVIEGYPDRFAVIREGQDGTFTVRFNRFPIERTRIEVECTPIPRDLKDNASSIPLVPRKHVDLLENAATFFLMLNKNDDRAQVYASLVSAELTAMINQHRGAEARQGKYFGQIVSRPDLLPYGRRRLVYGDKP